MRKSRTVRRARERRAAEDGGKIATTEATSAALVPFRRVATFWNWLPAFRAVAEYGGVVRAARVLHTSASSLSRAVGLLEDAVGSALFHKQGRSLALTPLGMELLAVARNAMRGVDDVVDPRRAARGVLHVGATSRVGVVRALGALALLRCSSPAIEQALTSIAQGEVRRALLAGHLDLALTLAPIVHDELVSVKLPAAENALFCGAGHPLYETPSARVERVLGYPFAAPETDEGGTTADGWPPSLARRVVLRSSIIDGGVDACARGDLLAVLPLEIVARYGITPPLRALSAVAIPPTSLFAVRRRSVSARRALADAMIDALAAAPVAGNPARSRPPRARQRRSVG